MSGSGMAQSALVSKAEREADLKGIDIDEVRPIDTEGAGSTIRVVYSAAPTEVDEVGFEVTRPPGPMGEQMFQEQLNNGFNRLRDYINGRDTDDVDDEDDDSAEAVDTTDNSAPEDSTRTEPSEQALSPPAADTVVSEEQITVTLETQLTDADREALTSDLEAVATDIGASADTDERVVELEDRVAELEAQIEAFQKGLSSVVSADTDETS